MSHEAAPHTSTPDRNSSIAAAEWIDSLPERTAARDTLRENPQLQEFIDSGVHLALSDVHELKQAADKADKNFVVGVQLNAVGPLPVSLRVKRGRGHLEEKATKAREKAQKASAQEEKLRHKVASNPYSNKHTSAASRRQARKEIRQTYKANRLNKKVHYLTEAVANEPYQKWKEEANSTRSTAGYEQLRTSLTEIEPELERRRALRAKIEAQEVAITLGELKPNTPDYEDYLLNKEEVASWGGETDEEYATRMKTEATEAYSEQVKVDGYESAKKEIENRSKTEKGARAAKTQDPEKYRELRMEMAAWKPIREVVSDMVHGDTVGYNEWVQENAAWDMKEELEKIDENQKLWPLLVEFNELIEQSKELLEKDAEFEEKIENAQTDEEKNQLIAEAAPNTEKLDELRKEIGDRFEKIEALKQEEAKRISSNYDKKVGANQL